MGLVDIVLPTGEQATVPQEDLAQAQAAGAHVPTEREQEQKQIGGLLGQIETGIIGAGRTATFGLSDVLLTEGADITQGLAKDLGIEQSLRRQGLSVDRKDMQKVLSLARETNKYSDMAGEAAGLFVGPGGGVTAAGEAAEGAIGARLGEGLLGRTAAMAGRGAAEGALIGAQHELTEETLGDTGLNGEKVAVSMMKDGLLGGIAGGVLGAGGHYVSEATSGLRSTLPKARGPLSDATLDTVVGVKGAGRLLQQDARATESLIGDLRARGATSEQAAKMADELNTITRTAADAGKSTDVIDQIAEQYIARRAGNNAEMREVLQKGFSERASRLAKQEELLDMQARRMADAGTRAMRQAEDTLNDVHFTSKPEQMAKLVDATRSDAIRDAVAVMNQDLDRTLEMLESTATKGGGEVAVKRLRKELIDRSKINATLARGADGKIVALKPAEAHELFIGADKMKRAIGKYSGFGKPEFMRTEAEREFSALYDRLRVGLEDEAVWGPAGAAQREWNETFSTAKGRRDDFGRRFSVSIDQAPGGVPLPELDAGKVKGFLGQLGGAEADQGVKTTESFLSGIRDRMNAIEKYGDLTTAQRTQLAEGKKALKEFEATFAEARKESEIVNRLKQQQLEEQGKALGGVLGLVSDIATRPLTTMERLASVKATTQKVEQAIVGALDKFFGGKGKQIVDGIVDRVKPRPKAEAVKELGEIRSLAGNMPAMRERARRMLGDLSQHAPQIAKEAEATAIRSLMFLAQEAPRPSTSMALVASKRAEPRYSDQQIAEWETKRRAALDPTTVLDDMRRGKINREAIRTIEFVSPKLYAEMQRTAQDYIERLRVTGQLDKMPYQQQAALATLLKVPADGTWRPDFIALMQAAKAVPAPTAAPAPGAAPQQTSKRAIKINTDVFATEAQAIEAGGVA